MGKIRRFFTRTIKDVELAFETAENVREIEKFEVVYRSHSQKFLEELEQTEEVAVKKDAEDKTVPYSVYLSVMVISIKDRDGEDLTNDLGEAALVPLPATTAGDEYKAAVAHNRAFFESMPIRDGGAEALFKAIEADVNPQRSSPGPGLSGSSTEASEE